MCSSDLCRSHQSFDSNSLRYRDDHYGQLRASCMVPLATCPMLHALELLSRSLYEDSEQLSKATTCGSQVQYNHSNNPNLCCRGWDRKGRWLAEDERLGGCHDGDLVKVRRNSGARQQASSVAGLVLLRERFRLCSLSQVFLFTFCGSCMQQYCSLPRDQHGGFRAFSRCRFRSDLCLCLVRV